LDNFFGGGNASVETGSTRRIRSSFPSPIQFQLMRKKPPKKRPTKKKRESILRKNVHFLKKLKMLIRTSDLSPTSSISVTLGREQDDLFLRVDLQSLSKIVHGTERGDVTNEQKLRTYLARVVHALKKDTHENYLGDDVLLHLVHCSMERVDVDSQLQFAKCDIRETPNSSVPDALIGIVSSFSKPVSVLVELPSGDRFLIALKDGKLNSPTLASIVRSFCTSGVVFLNIAENKVDWKNVGEGGTAYATIAGRDTSRSVDDDGVLGDKYQKTPAVTKKGKPCIDCEKALRLHGRRCWRESHKMTGGRDCSVQGKDGTCSNRNALTPAMTKKGKPCADCENALKLHGKRCWRDSHKINACTK